MIRPMKYLFFALFVVNSAWSFEPQDEKVISRVFADNQRQDHYFLQTADGNDMIRFYRCSDSNKDKIADTCLLIHPRALTRAEIKRQAKFHYWNHLGFAMMSRGTTALMNRCFLNTPAGCDLQKHLYFTHALNHSGNMTYRHLEMNVLSGDFLEKIIHSFIHEL